MICLQQTMKLPGFSLHQVTDDSQHSARGLAQRLVCLYIPVIEFMIKTWMSLSQAFFEM